MAFNFDLIDKPLNIEAGEWWADFPGHEGMRMKLRSLAYKPYFEAHNDLLLSGGDDPRDFMRSDDYKAANGALLAEHILIDWEKAWVHDGKDMPYDANAAFRLLTSVDGRGLGDAFRQLVIYGGQRIRESHMGVIEAIEGNSEPPSSGSPQGAAKKLNKPETRRK